MRVPAALLQDLRSANSTLAQELLRLQQVRLAFCHDHTCPLKAKGAPMVCIACCIKALQQCLAKQSIGKGASCIQARLAAWHHAAFAHREVSM